MKIALIALLLIGFLYVSCLNDSKHVAGEINSLPKDSIVDKVDLPDRNSVLDAVIHDSVKSDIKVSAYLIYDDGTLSAFDVLNNDSVMLWNAVAGGGDVLKPSHSTRFVVNGENDGMAIRVRKGNKLAFEKQIQGSANKFEFDIKGTGCELVFVNITKGKKLVLNDTIPFHCGE